MDENKRQPNCRRCGWEGQCYCNTIPGADPEGGLDKTRFFFICSHCHYVEMQTSTGDWDFRCPFCGRDYFGHKRLPNELKTLFNENDDHQFGRIGENIWGVK